MLHVSSYRANCCLAHNMYFRYLTLANEQFVQTDFFLFVKKCIKIIKYSVCFESTLSLVCHKLSQNLQPEKIKYGNIVNTYNFVYKYIITYVCKYIRAIIQRKRRSLGVKMMRTVPRKRRKTNRASITE